MTSPPGWVPQGAFCAADFRRGLYWQQGNPSGGFSAPGTNSAQWVMWSDGHVSLVAPGNLPVSDLGAQFWEASTNLVTATNDLTNGAWTKTNVTVARNAIGPDLVVNSASTITATANNGTVSQAITATSSNIQASWMLRRLTGSGAVSLSIDGGATYTALSLTASWQQLSIPQQTLANPTIVLKLATNGDAVQAYCSQVEAGLLQTLGPTAPMPTGTSSRAPFPGLDDAERERHKGELVYPNLLLSLSAEHVAAFVLRPLATLGTRVGVGACAGGGATVSAGANCSGSLSLAVSFTWATACNSACGVGGIGVELR